jgi:hypothetical protein
MNALSKEDLVDILEKTALAQLKALRSLRRPAASRPGSPGQKSKSNMDIVYDILSAAPGPLHINEIIQQARQTYSRRLSRESLVSALAKKVLDQNTYTRTAPNTFDLLQRPKPS